MGGPRWGSLVRPGSSIYSVVPRVSCFLLAGRSAEIRDINIHFQQLGSTSNPRSEKRIVESGNPDNNKNYIK